MRKALTNSELEHALELVKFSEEYGEGSGLVFYKDTSLDKLIHSFGECIQYEKDCSVVISEADAKQAFNFLIMLHTIMKRIVLHRDNTLKAEDLRDREDLNYLLSEFSDSLQTHIDTCRYVREEYEKRKHLKAEKDSN